MPDDLTIIEGIGPKIAGVLRSSGITTFDQSAAQSIEQLQEILDRNDLRLADPSSWTEQAQLAAAGDKPGSNGSAGPFESWAASSLRADS